MIRRKREMRLDEYEKVSVASEMGKRKTFSPRVPAAADHFSFAFLRPLCALLIGLALSAQAADTGTNTPPGNSPLANTATNTPAAGNTTNAPVSNLGDLGLEKLMHVEVPIVTAASKVDQKTTEAPASVTVVTADEIQKYHARTLADVLRTVPGL